MSEKKTRIEICMSEKDKEKVSEYAERCGLTISEYIRQRTLGYEPKAVLPGVFYLFLEKMDALIEKNISPEVNEFALKLLQEITNELIKPRKENLKTWRPPDSGLLKES